MHIWVIQSITIFMWVMQSVRHYAHVGYSMSQLLCALGLFNQSVTLYMWVCQSVTMCMWVPPDEKRLSCRTNSVSKSVVSLRFVFRYVPGASFSDPMACRFFWVPPRSPLVFFSSFSGALSKVSMALNLLSIATNSPFNSASLFL